MAPVLSLDRVTKSYRRGRHEIVALDCVSFELQAGELVTLFGRRAAGKSTLLRIAAGLDAPDSGAVTLNGADLFPDGRPRRLGGLPDGVGWVQRSGPMTPSMPMREYVAMPLLEHVPHRLAEQRATQALDRMAAGQLATARWSAMTDVERTLAALARAAVREPALLLADDPTIGLDTREREIVLGLLRRTAEETGAAVLVAVPEVPDMLRAHRVMSLDDGELMQPTRHRSDGPAGSRRSRDGSAR